MPTSNQSLGFSALFRHKLPHHLAIWLIAALVFSAVWIQNLTLIESDRVRTLASAESDLVNLARVSAEHAERTFSSVDLAVRLVQWEYAAHSGQIDLQLMAEQGLFDPRILAQLAVIDAKGILQLSTLPFEGRIDLSDREHFKVHLTGDKDALFISRPVLGRASGQWTIQLSRRLTGKDGRFAGVVVVSLDPGYFTQFYGELELGDRGVATLFGMDGAVRARRVGNQEQFGGDLSKSPVFTYLAAGQNLGTYQSPGVIDGVDRLLHFRKLASYPMLIAIGADSRDALADHVKTASDLQRQAAMASLFVLFIAVLVSWYAVVRRRHSLEQAKALALLQNMTSRVPGVVYQFLLHTDGRTSFPFASEGVREIYGVSPGDIYQDAARVFSLIHPDDAPGVRASIRESANTLTQWEQEYRVRLNDGTERWLSGSAAPQKLKNGAVLWNGFISDITKRRLTEDSLITLSAAVEQSPVSIVISDPAGAIQYVNPMFTRVSGYSSAETIGKQTRFLASGEISTEYEDAMWADLASGKVWAGEFHNRHKDGSLFWEQATIAPIVDSNGKVIHYLAIKEDITGRKQLESQQRIAATAFESHEGMFITDGKGIILRVNQAFSRITGYSAQEAVGQRPSLLSSGRHDAAFYAAMRASVEEFGSWQGEIWNRRKNGEIFPEWLTITGVKDECHAVTHYVSTLTDITARKAAEDQIKNLAFYDPLTRLPNRRLLIDRLQHAVASSMRNLNNGALLFIDLDNFKNINDTLGHAQGDFLLQHVAERLDACVRDGDTVARLGGDEFVVMLQDLSDSRTDAATQAEVVGEKILASLRQPYLLNGVTHHSSASLGVTLFSGSSDSVEDLLKRADLALYQAKDAGRNTLRFFDPEMQAAMTARAELEADLRQGLQAEQFLLFYQPQVDMRGILVGAEALVRWQHPRRGLVSPAHFIPLAEETRLILPLGQWVLKTACQQLKAWSASPHTAGLTISVNVSALQFHSENFVQGVLDTIALAGAPPHRLKLELTESLLVDDVDDIIGKMLALKAKGVGFSLDDFGTGYSSLSYLKRLPLDQLKIDQSFLHEALTNSKDAAIIRATVALGRSLGMMVIAEGVETLAQRDFLLIEGCHNFQGYYFGRPGPVDDLELFFPLLQPQ
jgi:diguanylate cyclase (GGDEF)-like protein/PAS domain S-box-containing protein